VSLLAVDRPALGAFLESAEVSEARERRRWLYEMSRLDFRARLGAANTLIGIHGGLCAGRRLDLVAEDLVVLATRIEDVPQRLIGGWGIYPWLIGEQP
jgi:hypothetical protein